MVDEQHAVEVVDLVLQAGREQAVGLDLVRLALEVEIFDLDLRRALDLLVEFRDRQAALLVGRLLVRLQTISGLMKTWGFFSARPSWTNPS